MSITYFAYGSNMCEGRLKARTPSAACVDTARLDGFVLKWNKLSTLDGSGKANLVSTGDTTDCVFGVVFKISEADKPKLDKAEGLGAGGYQEEIVGVIGGDGKTYQAVTYMARGDSLDDALHPFDWYVRFVIEGAKSHDLPVGYVETLMSVVTDRDSNTDRAERNNNVEC
jgi:gamma-glutamylcyclotransferase